MSLSAEVARPAAPPRRRIPVVQQLQGADCGAACLAMVLAHHRRRVPLARIQEAIGIDRDGADGGAILRAAGTFGLRSRGLAIDVDQLADLPQASILHWGFNHFVVFERITRRGVDLVDPASGRRTVTMQRFRRSFTGIALVFEPVADFAPVPDEPSRYLAHLRRIVTREGSIARIVVISLLLRLLALSLPALTGLIVDRVVPHDDRGLLLAVSLGLGILTVFQLAASLLRGLLLLQLRGRLDLELSLGFLDHLLALPYAFFQRRSVGDLLLRLNSHATLREMLTTSAVSALLDGPLVATYLILLFLVDPLTGALVLALGIAQVAIFLVSRDGYRDLAAQELEARARAQGYLVQLVGGIETLKAQGAERLASERWSNLFADEINASLRRARVAAVVDALRGALRTLGPLSILAIGALQVIDGSLTLGTMMALSALAAGFLGPLDALVESALQLQLLWSHVDRIDDVLRAEPERPPAIGGRCPRLTGEIDLSGVSFGYTRDGAPVLREIDVHIPAGSCVAIVGPSGSGKSTLAKVMLGLYPPVSGRVSYDGVPLSELDPRGLRRQLGIVMQKPHLFGGSIRSNLALSWPGAALGEVVAAARRAGIHDTIAAMPMGYETLVGEDGDALSGGERQRLALARALLGRPAILLLDEATNALDTETEAAVMENLAEMACTRILIAHRLSTVANADLILVVDGGRIVERGTHAELMRRGGRYQALVEAQS